MMPVLLALLLAGATDPPNFLERSLAERCGTQVLDRARVWVMGGDRRMLIYDHRLSRAQISCLFAWAAAMHDEVANGVQTYATSRYPLGPYDAPPELKERR